VLDNRQPAPEIVDSKWLPSLLKPLVQVLDNPHLNSLTQE
jgi:hypothetical protein